VSVPAPAAIEIKRHYRELSEKETQEVVEAVADLIVTFLKGRSGPARPACAANVAAGRGAEAKQESEHERDREHRADAR
jgi:ribosomal protein L12E/L44/L45/RPP1/RPP2